MPLMQRYEFISRMIASHAWEEFAQNGSTNPDSSWTIPEQDWNPFDAARIYDILVSEVPGHINEELDLDNSGIIIDPRAENTTGGGTAPSPGRPPIPPKGPGESNRP